MLKLYHCATSHASQKARLYLAEKNIAWQSKIIDLRTQEHISSDYRYINPQGTVPAIQLDSGEIVCGSTDIMLNLEGSYPLPALIPTDPKLQLEAIAICRAHEALHDPHLRTLSYQQTNNTRVKNPIKVAFTQYKKAMIATMALNIFNAIGFYTFFIFIVTYFVHYLYIAAIHALVMNTLSLIASIIMMPISGYLSDSYGRKKILLSASTALLISIYPIFHFFSGTHLCLLCGYFM